MYLLDIHCGEKTRWGQTTTLIKGHSLADETLKRRWNKIRRINKEKERKVTVKIPMITTTYVRSLNNEASHSLAFCAGMYSTTYLRSLNNEASHSSLSRF
jgi:hypothetical protein